MGRYLQATQKGVMPMIQQVVRSGTAVGALNREAIYAESKLDFAHKLSIARKECSETIYWLKMLYESKYLTEQEYMSINHDATELLK